jgi:two-component system chemotaxis sensor kinase CheA
MTVKLEDYPMRRVGGQRMLVLRDEVLPVLDLASSLGYPEAAAASYGVAVRGSEGRVVLAVDHLVGQRELVTRPLPEGVGAHAALSGGAVLSSGQIALVLDCDALTATVKSEVAAVAAAV